jgi:heat shock protein HtpX
MIMALRKIEGRGELHHATSAVMEMCIDNPREGFADLFATHPSIEARVHALTQFAGGHDPGPLALPEPEQPDAEPAPDTGSTPAADAGQTPPPAAPGPWGPGGVIGAPPKPFLPGLPPIGGARPAGPAPGSAPGTTPGSPNPPPPGPWGPRRSG